VLEVKNQKIKKLINRDTS